MKNKFYLVFLIVLVGSFLFSGNLFAVDPDLGMYGFLKIGKHKKEVKWNRTIVLTPSDVTLISNGIPAFEVYYAYREYAGVAVRGFKNKIYFNNKLVSQQTNLYLTAKQIKHVHTQAYLGPKNGKLQIKIDADNNIKESRENNNFGFYVNIVFKGFNNVSKFKVTKVKAAVSPNSFSGKCPKKFLFKGYIYANGAGIVKYQWKRSDNAIAPINKVIFRKAGVKLVESYWVLGAEGTHWKALAILSPNRMMSNKAVFKLKCKTVTTQRPVYSIYNIKLSPKSSAYLDLKQKVNIVFKYKSSTAGIYIWARPMTGNNPTSGYAASASKLYTTKNGAGSQFFMINSGKGIVDGIRFQIKDKNEKLLYTKIMRVKYKYPKPVVAKAPQRFFLDFVDAYLVYTTASNSIQVTTENNVLSYGSDWKKYKIKPYLYHLKQNFWKGFYWKINTSRKEAYLMKGNNFGRIGDTGSKINNITVDIVGGSLTVAPTRFFLRFKKASLVYVPSSKTVQITAGNKVLSYGSDWKKCNLKPYLFQIKQNFWKGFVWQINTSRKLAQRSSGGQFCAIGGTKANLKMGVRVIQ